MHFLEILPKFDCYTLHEGQRLIFHHPLYEEQKMYRSTTLVLIVLFGMFILSGFICNEDEGTDEFKLTEPVPEGSPDSTSNQGTSEAGGKGNDNPDEKPEKPEGSEGEGGGETGNDVGTMQA